MSWDGQGAGDGIAWLMLELRGEGASLRDVGSWWRSQQKWSLTCWGSEQHGVHRGQGHTMVCPGSQLDELKSLRD